jgi:hypothetical protein
MPGDNPNMHSISVPRMIAFSCPELTEEAHKFVSLNTSKSGSFIEGKEAGGEFSMTDKTFLSAGNTMQRLPTQIPIALCT